MTQYVCKIAPELLPHLEVPDANMPDAIVPCGTCQLCCKGFSAVIIMPDHGDDPALYQTFKLPMPGMEGSDFLQWKENGDCIHLTPEGCAVHDRAPFMCRIFDCRDQHAMYPKRQREMLVKKGMLKREVLRRGAILIHQQKKQAK